jgi:ADP-dependent NAD(P)H-hydrate dehydratase / NAD(P)H-hydrate epimerase
MESPVVSSAQMRDAENAAFARGVSVEALMDEAGAGIARAVRKFFPRPGVCAVYAGKGHNGGDALVAAEHLQRLGWKIDILLAFPEEDCSELTRKKIAAVRKRSLGDMSILPRSHTVILDGLLGLGAKHLLREPIRTLAHEINRRRREENAFVFAIDLPSGMDSDSGEKDPEDCVVADCTVTIAFAKHGLVVDETLDYVGRIEVVPLVDLPPPEAPPHELVATPHALAPLLPRRKFSAYKNQFGRVGIVAGSEGFIGAAIMTTKGALRGGAGLVNLFVPRDLYSLVTDLAPDEAMVKPLKSYKELAEQNVDVWAVGPGLGLERAADIVKFIESAPQPIVLDADALNALVGKLPLLKRAPGPRLLTPHPGEMDRLVESGKMSRPGRARTFTDHFPVTLMLKGGRSVVCEKGKPISYNSTGNPGMATGGMGDVLTGVCAALVAQKLSMYDAARMGAWVCGRAAEMSIFQSGASQESLLPSDVLDHLGRAFNDMRSR